MKMKKIKLNWIALATAFVLVSAAFGAWNATANEPLQQPEQQDTTSLHPLFPLLDVNGENVLETDNPVSTMQTCGACHDAPFIAEHSFHVDAGLADFMVEGNPNYARVWDLSTGIFGEWNTFGYRNFTQDRARFDMGVADWIMQYGARHVGGGPAAYTRDGIPLTALSASDVSIQTHVLDPLTGEPIPWDWNESGTVEMNCFLCHIPSPNNAERLIKLHDGQFRWANTATLVGSGIVNDKDGDSLQYNRQAFDGDGNVLNQSIKVQDPENDNCGLCHGLVHDSLTEPLSITECAPERYRTVVTGQVVSPQRISDSAMNVSDKKTLNRSWDIHAERLLSCTDCHYSLNNPVYFEESDATKPDHLTFDPRRLELGEYLRQPNHDFARGNSAQGTFSLETTESMRRCESCHDAESVHTWLPYPERHFDAMSCETCHIPQLYAPAAMQVDWTVLTLDGSAKTDCRGVQKDESGEPVTFTGYSPVLLNSLNGDGSQALAPHNLISTWLWVYGDPPQPVRLLDLQSIWLEDGTYAADILTLFDEDKNGSIEDQELVINTSEKEELIAGRLASLGLENPRIIGEVQPYSINHNVINGQWVTRDCKTCHNNRSLITTPIQLASYVPNGVEPAFVNSRLQPNGDIFTGEDGSLHFKPNTSEAGLYILGYDSVKWIDVGGAILFVLVLLGISGHAGIRVFNAIRNRAPAPAVEKVYMYHRYERIWHWLQTLAIVILAITGLIIHKPNIFGIFNFNGVVIVHNVLAAILGINAFLSLFYHLVSGEIKQYIPHPKGFFDQAITQTLFYVKGIFKHEAHPFEKTPQKKLNPLQQITYFGILNVLLPLQGITGILIWGGQKWPITANKLGGLPFLSPLHTITAWLFVSFIVGHVYLTTTGHEPLGAIKAMINGWDEVEIHTPPTEEISEEVSEA